MIPVVSNGNKLRWKFKNIKDVTADEVRSRNFTVDGPDWIIKINTETKDNVKWLSIYLHYVSNNITCCNWICKADRTVKLLNQNGNGQDRLFSANNCYSAKSTSWGWPSFIRWSELESYGYVKEDSVIVEVDLSFKYYDFSIIIPNYTDITINVEGTHFYVNKGVLISKSEYFYDLFVDKKSSETTITIRDVTVEDFRYFIASFYQFFESVNIDNYKRLIKLAEKYGVPTLHRNCEKFLISQTGIELTEKLKYADKHNYHELMKTCIDSLKTAQQIKILQKSVEFHNFKESTKLCIMLRILDFY